jgi:hypothetical protein
MINKILHKNAARVNPTADLQNLPADIFTNSPNDHHNLQVVEMSR